MTSWFVVIELRMGTGAPMEGDPEAVQALLQGLPGTNPVALCQPDRCAVQVCIAEPEPQAALAAALAGFSSAAASSVLATWELARIELLTPQELEDGWDQLLCEPEGRELIESLDGDPDDDVRQAEVAIDRLTRPDEARDVIARLVHRLGGGVVSGRPDDDWTLPVDISFGAGEPSVAIAEPWTVSRIRLEQVLTQLVDRAHTRLARVALARLSDGYPDAHGADAPH